VGRSEGTLVGFRLGREVGEGLGLMVGAPDGREVGADVGFALGAGVVRLHGFAVGLASRKYSKLSIVRGLWRGVRSAQLTCRRS
jgi:hypothetical protein